MHFVFILLRPIKNRKLKLRNLSMEKNKEKCPTSGKSMASISKPSEMKQSLEVSNSSSNEGEKVAKPKLPPIKAPVGLAKGPDLKNCKSKVGSLNNIKHKPIGGKITIESQKLKWNAKSKVGSLENKEHKPGGGKIKVETQKLQWNTTSKVQSLQNVHHKPGGGNIKIFNEAYAESGNNKANKTADQSLESSELSSSKLTSGSKIANIKTNDNDNDSKTNNPTTNKSTTKSIAEDLKGLSLKD